jgi:hypothetical protein
MRDGRFGFIGRRWLAALGAAIVVCLLVLYSGAFFLIRHRANFDYELMLWGERPRYTDNKPLPVADGGSLVYIGFGYEEWRVNRMGPPPLPGASHWESVGGTELVFTCRRFFPGLERYLEDRDDTHVVVPIRRAPEPGSGS